MHCNVLIDKNGQNGWFYCTVLNYTPSEPIKIKSNLYDVPFKHLSSDATRLTTVEVCFNHTEPLSNFELQSNCAVLCV